MENSFEENLGKYTYVDIGQLKDYLAISSNTLDARTSNIIYYATSVIEHYIGQEIKANNYTELFDGGSSSVFVSRLPLNNVYQVSEFNGVNYSTLSDPTSLGTPVISDSPSVSLTMVGATNTSRIKKFGSSSVVFNSDDYIIGTAVPYSLQLEEGDFTIEMFVRVDENTLQDNIVFSLNTDSFNYLRFSLANQYGLAFEANVAGALTRVTGANTSIESQEFSKRKWAHIGVSRVLEDEKIYLSYNGNIIANTSYAVSNHTFTSNVVIGETFKGYIDELRVSSIARYTENFTPPTHRFSTDDDTVLLTHFDGKHNTRSISDVHSKPGEYIFNRNTGEISKAVLTGSNPNISINSLQKFNDYPSGVKVEYRAGYEEGNIPYDLQLVTLDYIKILYKQTQEKQNFSFEGEKGEAYSLSGGFPPHIRRVLDLYRILK